MRSKLIDPTEYVAFDTETTGLYHYAGDELLEVAGVKVRDGVVVDTWQSFSQPQRRSSWPEAENVNHISPDMVKGSPNPKDVVEAFLEWVGDLPLIGHNAAGFDTQFFYQVLGCDPENDLVDTLRVCRRLIQSENYRLPDMYDLCVASGANPLATEGVAHRALFDSLMTATVYEFYRDRISGIKGSGGTGCFAKREFSESTEAKRQLLATVREFVSGTAPLDQQSACDLLDAIEDCPTLDADKSMVSLKKALRRSFATPELMPDERDEIMNELARLSDPVVRDAGDVSVSFGDKVSFVLTGDFELGRRSAIETRIKALGSKCSGKVSGRTSFVVVGNQGSQNWSFGSYGGKVDDALRVQADGKPVQIICEDIFVGALLAAEGD